jgi:hypothetical protein
VLDDSTWMEVSTLASSTLVKQVLDTLMRLGTKNHPLSMLIVLLEWLFKVGDKATLLMKFEPHINRLF